MEQTDLLTIAVSGLSLVGSILFLLCCWFAKRFINSIDNLNSSVGALDKSFSGYGIKLDKIELELDKQKILTDSFGTRIMSNSHKSDIIMRDIDDIKIRINR